jgi:hypothetical protein
MKFIDKVKDSLSVYRVERLGIKEPGIYKRGRMVHEKGHVLPIKFKTHNIIQSYRDDFYSSPSSDIDFHKYSHHLSSSQALCINLFYPLMHEGRLDLILDLLDTPKQSVVEVCFEKESDIENGAGRRTNFDFYIRLSDNTKVYFEIKYTEDGFGTAPHDEAHEEKYVETYEPLLNNNAYINLEHSGVNEFLDSYQIMRNLCHISDDSYVVFVYPKANEKVHAQAQSVPNKVLTDKGREKFKILLLEDIADEILGQVESERLKDHYQEFKAKYLSYNEI